MTSPTSSSKKRSPSTRPAADPAPQILVVEDDASVRSLLVKALRDSGYRVQATGDGLDALRLLDASPPELLMVDIMIPQLDGMALVKAVKQQQQTSGIPVIFLTACSDPQSMIAGIDVGARYYVTKPFRIEDVLAKVEKALKRR